MATHGGITGDVLSKLAEDIETAEQMEALGRTLGINNAAINRYTETNKLEGRVTCKGTRDMLFDWRQTTEPSNQHTRMKQALIEANLVMLAETHFKETSTAPDIYSEKISERLTVLQCRTILEQTYSNQLCKIQMKPWDKEDYAEFEDMHTVVTMTKKDNRGKNTTEKKILQGSVSEILSTKVNGRLPSRIVISAPAGRGKTTAVAKMAYDWIHRKKGSGLEDLPLLFVVKFRNTTHETSIGEAIISQLLSDVDDLTPEGLESFIRQHQKICHIVLDGLDEYAGISSSSNILNILCWKMFRQCRVLVTTRPHLEHFFSQGDLPKVYTKMGIEGFSRESSRDYIDRFFTSIQKRMSADGLKAYLDEQPLIEELVKTPLFCLMVCHLWSEDLLQSETTTQTALLDKVNVFLMLHANARAPRLIITPQELNEMIHELGEVALTGLLNDAKKLVFTSCDFQRIPSILEMACSLGIVSKTIVSTKRLPQMNQTTNTTIEFYHKLAQEHAAGKFLADETNRFLFFFKMSKLDRVLRNIKRNIGEYENLIRFACGTNNSLSIRIMETLLMNSYLSESERYRILLDCSSESFVSDDGVSSLVQRCVTSQSILLKSPTVYTVVGMRNLPRELKQKVKRVKFEESVLTAAVTDGLWSCLGSFSMLHTLDISDSSLSFPSPPPELQSVTKLSAVRVTSQCYEGLISSLPGLLNVDVRDVSKEDFVECVVLSTRLTSLQRLDLGSLDSWSFTFDTSTGVQICNCQLPTEMTTRMWSCLRPFTSENQLRISDSSLSFPSSPPELPSISKLSVERVTSQCYEGLVSSLPGLLNVDVRGVNKEDFVRFVDLSTRVTSLQRLDLGSLDSWSFNFDADTGVQISNCQLPTEMTTRLWSCLRSFTSMNQLRISDSSLSFPSSPPELPSISKLSAKRVTSQCYEGLVSSLPGLLNVDVRDVSKEDFVEFVGLSTRVTSLQRLELGSLDSWSFNFDTSAGVQIRKCHLSNEMTTRMWSCLRSFTSLSELSISDSSLSFTSSHPEIPSVSHLSAEKVTSQSYEGLLSSLPGLVRINVTIKDADRDISQITSGLRRTGGRKITHINIKSPSSLLSEKNCVSRGTMRGLGMLIKEHIKNLQELRLIRVKSKEEDDLVYLIECCRHEKRMEYVRLMFCGTMLNGRLQSYLKHLDRESSNSLRVCVNHDDGSSWDYYWYSIPHIE